MGAAWRNAHHAGLLDRLDLGHVKARLATNHPRGDRLARKGTANEDHLALVMGNATRFQIERLDLEP
jgi:hypothetical protein